MTDKEIDQRLHDALTPDVPEDRLFVFKEMTKESEGTTMKLKKILKPAIVMAACAALILGVSRVPDFVSLKKAVTIVFKIVIVFPAMNRGRFLKNLPMHLR